MRIMRGIWLVAGLAWLPVGAADEQRLNEARALMKTMRIEQQLDAMTGAMGQAMTRELPSAGDPKVAQIAMAESMALMKERALQPGGMVDLTVNAYADLFTVEELRAMRAFYESPVGQKMLLSTPEMMARVMQNSFKNARETAPIICARVKARLQAEGIESPAYMKCPLVKEAS